MTGWRAIASRLCGFIAALLLAAMMLLTVADVGLRAFFNAPMRGVYELIELLLAGTFFLALPAVFLRNEHILVSVIDDMAPSWVPALNRIAALLAALVLALMAWQGFLAARDSYEFHDVTADLQLSRALHWSALLIGVVAAAAAALASAFVGNGRR